MRTSNRESPLTGLLQTERCNCSIEPHTHARSQFRAHDKWAHNCFVKHTLLGTAVFSSCDITHAESVSRYKSSVACHHDATSVTYGVGVVAGRSISMVFFS